MRFNLLQENKTLRHTRKAERVGHLHGNVQKEEGRVRVLRTGLLVTDGGKKRARPFSPEDCKRRTGIRRPGKLKKNSNGRDKGLRHCRGRLAGKKIKRGESGEELTTD